MVKNAYYTQPSIVHCDIKFMVKSHIYKNKLGSDSGGISWTPPPPPDQTKSEVLGLLNPSLREGLNFFLKLAFTEEGGGVSKTTNLLFFFIFYKQWIYSI